MGGISAYYFRRGIGSIEPHSGGGENYNQKIAKVS